MKTDRVTPALETRNLTKRFVGVTAVDNLSLHIERGAITGIVGPNGSGKTTLVNILAGMLTPDGGEIVVNGVVLPKLHPHDIRSYGITRTFQNSRLFEQMTVYDNIMAVLTNASVFSALFGRCQQCDHRDTEAVLRSVNLWEKRNELAATLSYGQRKLLEVARALATGADMYLFDEPFAGLFPQMVTTILTIMKDLQKKGKTVILIEHDMDLIRKITNHVIVMNNGKLLSCGTPEGVLSEEAVIEAYLGK